MTFSSRRLLSYPPVPALSCAALLLAVAGCSLTDDAVAVPVPTPSAEEAEVCRALHGELPETVDGQQRRTAEPESDLTAVWGDPAIVLRCGVPRPEKMSDAASEGVEADGVNWMLERQEDGGPRFTTTYREVYVEVSLPAKYAHDVTPLAAFAGPVKKTVPDSL
ncbi:hypothetical protein GCM10009730_22590 [Streptomyces albidochromogenes]|uniref:DUF3515 domain-containing protein n=1 Tax=Streptomyces albidochromogenes TaxID=329524 RepID=UPI00110FDDCE|nr:DUF3515 domain-containing protein [Streptomyces albidochromogenes]